ncbi:MAG: hypothetical protein CMI08_12365 [Oceanospirillaceae bacterium]|uniref:anti-sigma factor family protein n=1 Tax=unclassified Thalassolituus TaxID=2624967 RepID=UPI000C0A0889|nr:MULTISPECIES: hypothetical protein [unclassified Thalassolituus]MAK89949.1 hypothetical protein [Thalassolituus sp.]MAS24252.1 hypothetical protein [Oceanospirillaceae bacterium]MAX99969.1 hypothetical protein [Oceanospirillaceae bacterium]MBL36156.1 hypothetical protein [Oceanospirillaceae bacterium]MBS53072.1 hypothetical protein [Oceanospirillaceae bacterium]|tara:strand:+ start:4519 stop:5187 length:669 start_codon:yes stop_codon:yes gene_type:complete
MTQITQSELSAYLDDELAEDKQHKVHEALQNSEPLRQQLEELRLANQAAQEWFSDIDESPLPSGLEQMIRSAPMPVHAETNVVTLPSVKRKVFRPVYGIAASVLLAVTLLWQMELWQMEPSQLQDPQLNRFADTALSGDVLDSGEWKAELVMSWQAADGTRCREVRRHTSAHTRIMTACGEPGDWQWQEIASPVQYQTASGNTMIATDQRLTVDEERQWLQR